MGMPARFSYGVRLIRAAVLLGFLGCLVTGGTLSSQAAVSEFNGRRFAASVSAYVPTPIVSFTAPASHDLAFGFTSADAVLTEPLATSPADDDVAFEDSFEMLRVDLQQRVFGIDQAMIGPRVALKAALSTRLQISRPLLV
jgi:hypothetical protein